MKFDKGWAKACAGATVRLIMNLSPGEYSRNCARHEGKGLPFYLLDGTFTLDAAGTAVTSSAWKAGHFFER